jgi:5-methylcytosine-specific restriction endonuclease McrA
MRVTLRPKMESDPEFLALRRCMRTPIPEISLVVGLLDQATTAHLQGDFQSARALIHEANASSVREWTESLWGSESANPEQWRYRRFRTVPTAPPNLPKDDRVPVRMPSNAEKNAIISKYGRHCVFCGIPPIRMEIRMAFCRAYPQAAIWGPTNATQHAAFQCTWMQFDHIVPHSRGGDNSVENVVVTCAPCNFGRMQYTLDELGLLDPRDQPRRTGDWDGLERLRTNA